MTDVVRTAGRVTGAVAQTAEGELRVEPTFTVAADGRRSTVRDRLRLTAEETGVPIDVLWLRLPRPTVPLPDTLGLHRGLDDGRHHPAPGLPPVRRA